MRSTLDLMDERNQSSLDELAKYPSPSWSGADLRREVCFAPNLVRYPMAAWFVPPLVLPIAFATVFLGYVLYQTFA
jgi:hypothetical protein